MQTLIKYYMELGIDIRKTIECQNVKSSIITTHTSMYIHEQNGAEMKRMRCQKYVQFHINTHHQSLSSAVKYDFDALSFHPSQSNSQSHQRPKYSVEFLSSTVTDVFQF